ncbi:hypothetical protein [Coralloluteibacterium thermophilus]|uniref:Beta-barrel assembly machine subunit BamC n=1 Tax=Coralloluteibacterium thermophilum TaxID=2707049 RepID=A0ABV9NNC8_9GAMM
MSTPSTRSRLLLAGLVGALLVTSGCGWFRRDDAAYQRAMASNPLELPPGLDMPRADPAMTIPGTAGAATASTTPRTAAAGVSFTVAGTVQEVWARMGAELDAIEGVSILNRAQLLGTYEVRYQDQSFLLRTQAQGDSVIVSALGADGRALGEGPAADLVVQLRERMG